MLFLWMFGREVEKIYGSREFTVFYLTAAIFSTLCWALVDRLTPDAGIAYTRRGLGRGDGGGDASTCCTTRIARCSCSSSCRSRPGCSCAVYLGYDAVMLRRSSRGWACGPAFAVGVRGAPGRGALRLSLQAVRPPPGPPASRRNRRPRLRVVSPPPRSATATASGPSPMPATSVALGRGRLGGQGALAVGVPRGAARRPARRGARQDRPRGRQVGPDRGRAPHPPGGLPPSPGPAERPALR